MSGWSFRSSRKSALRLWVLSSAVLLSGVLAQSAGAASVQLWFVRDNVMYGVGRQISDSADPMEAALQQLVAGPTANEQAVGVTSAIPAGTQIASVTAGQDSVTIDFSAGLLANGLNEITTELIFRQVNWTLRQFGSDKDVSVTVAGKLLASYLPPTPKVEAKPVMQEPGTMSLSGHSVTLSPGHGWFWNGSGWHTQRPVYCSPLSEEDFHTLEMVQYLQTYLAADGMTVKLVRCLDKNFGSDDTTTGTHIASGKPWWQMASNYWTQQLGYPCGVYASYTGDCTTGSGGDEGSDDVRARPLMSDQDGTDIYVSVHTNGFAGDCTGSCPTGTETYYDSTSPQAAGSQTLANNINPAVLGAITSNVDASWSCHGTCVKNSNGAYGEIRIPNRPATLTELGFHDTCDRDADGNHLRDNYFRSAAMWGIYNGICAYFGTGPTWGFYSDEYIGDTIPTTMNAGQNYNVSITLRNRGVLWAAARNYRLGAVGDSDPFTATNRINIAGEVGPGNTYTFSFTMTAPATGGTYTTDWQMVRDGYTWFGVTLSKQILVSGGGGVTCGAADNNQGHSIAGYTVDWQSNPTSAANWGTGTCTGGISEWKTWGVNITGKTCTVYDRNLYWNSAKSWSGRGHFNTDVQVTCSGTATAKYVLLNGANGDTGTQPTLNQCPLNGWYNILNADWTDLSTNGWRTNPNIADAGNGCNANCGYPVLAASGLHMYGSRWQYINDWACLGGYGSASVSDTANRSFAWGESGLFVYPALDTSHGNTIATGLGFDGKTPGRVTTGDCNTTNSLNFKGNANAYGGGDNMDSYGFAWVYAPGGAGPKYLLGSDDGNRLWVNGNLVNDNNAARGLTRDQDETSGIAMPAGWSRVLFKVHNGTGGFEGAVSLRNGGDRRWNEPSVAVFDFPGYVSYGIGYEQDAWYPCVQVNTFYGGSNPHPDDNYYGNDTTVTAGGTASGNGPVPFWKVMYYTSGYGISGETNYTDVTSNGATWSHTETGVTGHRRLYFFAVSKSGRTSFQNSGSTGGSNWQAGGPGNYMDVFIDNAAPFEPGFAGVSTSDPTQVALSWSLPEDQGVGVDPGTTEYASETGDNAYRSGDVGINVRRNGTTVYGWGQETSFNDTGLTPNTAYTYEIAARDNSSEGRGAWHNTTSWAASTTLYTLAAAPSIGDNVVCDRAEGAGYPVDTTFTFSNPAGFGTGTHGGTEYMVSKFKYVWDQNATHTWDGFEADWNADTLAMTLNDGEGNYYLHLQSWNGDATPAATPTTLNYGPFIYDVTAPTVTIDQAGDQPDPARSSPINFTVVFSEPVTGFTDTGVTLDGTAGATTATVSGSGANYTVAVSGMIQSGTVIATIAAGACTDVAGNPNEASTSTDNSVAFDNTSPTIAIDPPSATVTTGGPVTFAVNYSDPESPMTVTLAVGDITLNKTETADGTVEVSGTGDSRTVTISGITGDGTLGISIAANTASDAAGNTADAAGPSATFVVDNTAPAIAIGAPSASSACAGDTVRYTVTYTDPNLSALTLGAADVTLVTTGTASGTVSVSGDGTVSPATRTVTVADLTGSGTIGISIAANTASDSAGHNAASADSTGTFTVSDVTSIVADPTDAAVCAGATAEFSVAASGADLSYRWQKDGADVSDGGHYSGATTATLAISSASGDDAGNYRCVVTGSCGSANSNDAALTLEAATAISEQPLPQTVSAGGTATFSVTATGGGTVAYQWQRDGVDLTEGGHYTGVATATLTVSDAAAVDAGNYRCMVSADCGSVASDEVALIVNGSSYVASDFDQDGDVDLDDFTHFRTCFNGPNRAPAATGCANSDFDHDNDVDLDDFTVFRGCFNGPNRAPACP